ncbi:Hypothetical Protein FCC1311_003852 [Hondaea fermentalgiana]|uniref:Prominin-1-A n=1 Tax=Hondaea fermentalgiana TaxID=2315210 RepID=A0A2R5FZI3_9STRA|nr:Hypothetical Protein FCC1311_003852 [Hondaea fermentalgiana]|eukprot:GBG24167.1 Hypothetical Protein FCC1311_003852 [Hondaea fermentalgiana]
MRCVAIYASAILAVLPASTLADAATFCDDYLDANSSSLADAALDQETISAGLEVANENADALVARLQSYRGENMLLDFIESGMEDEGSFAQDYAMSVVPFASPGIALAVLSLLACPCCVFCSNKCCCRKRKNPDEYSFVQKILPIAFYLFFCVVACSLAFVAISNIGSMVDGSAATLCEFDTLTVEMELFFNDIITPVDTITNLSATILPAVASQVMGTESMDAALVNLIAKVGLFNDTVGGVTLPSGFSSSFLDGAAAQVSVALDELTDQADPILESLNETRKTVNESIANSQELIIDTAASAKEAISGILEFRDDISDFVTDAKTYADQYLSTTTTASFAFFSTVFLSLVAGIFVLVTYATPCKIDDKVGRGCLSLSFCLSYLFMMLLFLLSGIFLPISIVFSDACAVMDVIPSNFSFYLEPVLGSDDAYAPTSSGSGSAGLELDVSAVLTECFSEDPPGILTVLGMSEQFDFGDAFDALEGDNTIDADALQFGDLETLSEDVHGLERADMGLTDEDIASALAALNDYARQFYTGSGSFVNYTFADCTPTDTCDRDCTRDATCAPPADHTTADQSTLNDARNGVFDLADAAGTIDGIISDLQSSMIGVDNATESFKDAVLAMNDTYAGIKITLQPLIDEVEVLKTAGDCSFIGEVYSGIYSELCESTLQPIIVLSLILLFIALCGIPMIITSLYIHARLYSPKKNSTVWTDEA